MKYIYISIVVLMSVSGAGCSDEASEELWRNLGKMDVLPEAPTDDDLIHRCKWVRDHEDSKETVQSYKDRCKKLLAE